MQEEHRKLLFAEPINWIGLIDTLLREIKAPKGKPLSSRAGTKSSCSVWKLSQCL